MEHATGEALLDARDDSRTAGLEGTLTVGVFTALTDSAASTLESCCSSLSDA